MLLGGYRKKVEIIIIVIIIIIIITTTIIMIIDHLLIPLGEMWTGCLLFTHCVAKMQTCKYVSDAYLSVEETEYCCNQ